MSSSAQVMLGLQNQNENWNQDMLKEVEFSNYHSPLALYPLLHSPMEAQSNTISLPFSIDLLSTTILTSDSNSSRSDTHFPDLKHLKLAVASKRLDPSQRICQYEVPGNGVCRDENCEDAHLSKLLNIAGSSGNRNCWEDFEPNDEDIAEYLFHMLPTDWLHRLDIKSPNKIKLKLEQVRLEKTLEERMRRALAALEPPPSQPLPE